jgi:hypothetical protein
MVCNLTQLSPEIWMMIPVEDKKWLLNGQKRQQKQDDSEKRSYSSVSKDISKIVDREKNNSNILNQYAKVKSDVKGEEEL